MRTGSNFLENNINKLPDLRCHGETFNPYILGGEGKKEMFGFTLAQRDADPAGFLRAMRAQTPGMAGFRYFYDHDPRVFDLVMQDPSCAKIILTRNQLESFISWKIATESDQWWLADTKHLQTVRPRFVLSEFIERHDALQAFQKKLVHALQISGQTAFYLDYEDVLDLEVIHGLAAFLGLPSRLERLRYHFKKQNPEPSIDKVSNPAEMKAALASVDWFDHSYAPNFEPRRQASVPHYLSSEGLPALFLPVKGGPEKQMRKWLQSYGPLVDGFDRNSLRKWKATHPGQRSFAVLRHPLARAYAAYVDLLAKDYMPELRRYMQTIHRFDLPPKGQAFADEEQFRDGFALFLQVVGHILTGRTGLRTLGHFATQHAILQGFGQLQAPDLLIREDRLAQGLVYLSADLGQPMHPLPEVAEAAPYPLASLYAPDLEALARDTYARDYVGYGFGDWAA